MKRIITVLLCAVLLVTGIPMSVSAAPEWPEAPEVKAEGAILMDADSGTVLYGKNIDAQYGPASITKILTALLIIENCGLDDELTFSHRAVYDVEENSSNAGYDEGDKVTVRTALYAMLLQSANEAANALAEHCSGTIEAFVEKMNLYAQSLGCRNTHFDNPSGLNGDTHYVSAYDYARICREAFKNETFRLIDGTTSYDLPPNTRNPKGLTIYTHHGMLKRSSGEYYKGAVGGKTGYTVKAGNTLVTFAERENLRLITVILNGKRTHYEDTRALLDYGFDHFKSVKVHEYENEFDTVYDILDVTGTGVDGADILHNDENCVITLPMGYDVNDTDTEISYDVGDNAPENAIARITYRFGSRDVGSEYITGDFSSVTTDVYIHKIENTADDTTPGEKAEKIASSLPVWVIIAAPTLAAVILILIVLFIVKKIRSGGGYPGYRNGRGRL